MTQRVRERIYLWISGAVVAATIVVGFLQLGSPSSQRALEFDRQRVRHLGQIATAIYSRTNTVSPQSVHSLAELHATTPYLKTEDPANGRGYEYISGNDTFQLCAVFDTDSLQDRLSANTNDFWKHPRGRHCYTFGSGVPPAVIY